MHSVNVEDSSSYLSDLDVSSIEDDVTLITDTGESGVFMQMMPRYEAPFI